MKKLLLIVAVLLIPRLSFGAACSATIAQGSTESCDSITQHSITWTLSTNRTVGQFVNGDYWVVDPGAGVSITAISPGAGTATSDGRAINGSMINPPGNTTATFVQGYDANTSYSASVNVGLSLPLTIVSGDSLISTISNDTVVEVPPGSMVSKAAVLTCLATAAPSGSFRPPISAVTKTLHNVSDLDLTLLKTLAVPSGQTVTSTTFDNLAAKMSMVWLNHTGSLNARKMRPDGYGMDNYYYANDFALAAVLLHLNFSNAVKQELLYHFIQLGIDCYGYVQSGISDAYFGMYGWVPDGGHSGGRKWPIMFAGVMLDHAGMKGIGDKSGDYINSLGWPLSGSKPADYISYGEDSQTYYVASTDVTITNGGSWNPCGDVPAPYTSEMIGMPEWSIRYAVDRAQSDSEWTSCYRTIQSNTPAWTGFQMAALVMDADTTAKTLWNHDAFFDYVDRYNAITDGDPDPCGFEVSREQSGGGATGLVKAFYDEYRTDYGGLCGGATPPAAGQSRGTFLIGQ